MRRRLRAVILLSFPLVLALPVAPARASSTGSNRDVEMLDNVFAPRLVRIPVGGTVEWANEGRGQHDVKADDGSFASAELGPGEAFAETFATEGAYPYFCSIHGSPGAGMTGLILVGDAAIPGSAPGVGPGRETPPSLPAPRSAFRKKRRRSRPRWTRPSRAASS
jgi:plastocyanin